MAPESSSSDVSSGSFRGKATWPLACAQNSQATAAGVSSSVSTASPGMGETGASFRTSP